MTKKLLFRLWLLLCPVAIGLFLYPINNLPLRAGLLLSLAGIWIGILYFGRNRKAVVSAWIGVTFLGIGFMIAPGRNYDREKLRETYVQSLQTFEGTRYIWGGENRLGIDCSGLARAGLIRANLRQGSSTLNPRLIRTALSLWWHDESAEALRTEYRQQTRFLFKSPNIDQLDQHRIKPGDIAVTGLHVLAYCGGDTWIEADPGAGKVIVVEVPAPQNPWFQQPVNLMRWTELE